MIEREKTVHLIGERVMGLGGLEVSYYQDVKFDLRDWFPDVEVGHLAVPEPWQL